MNNSIRDGSQDDPGNISRIINTNIAYHSSLNVNLEPTPSSFGAGLSEPENVALDNSLSNDQNLDSSELDNSYVNMEFSPFKSHKIIANDVIITRKISINKTKVPFAISAREHVKHLKEKQDKKKKRIGGERKA